jgi:coproporphyrinogen III oxidase
VQAAGPGRAGGGVGDEGAGHRRPRQSCALVDTRARYLAPVLPTPARSPRAATAHALVQALQRRFMEGLQAVSAAEGSPDRFTAVTWLRDDGRHGGGTRFEIGDTPVFDRGSINVSQVHYDDEPSRRLASASALSTIIHPASPHAPSVHMHFSFTEMRDGTGYWRLMADLNPAIPYAADTERFIASLRAAAPEHYDHAAAQGDRYFFIPVLGRHRGVTHFYLEGHRSDFEADAALTRTVGETTIDTYCGILGSALRERPAVTPDDRAAQLAYHTLYLFQVLTLDRGTTSGLLVHDQNDAGILGSLPSHVDRARLASWEPRMPPPQDALLRAIVAALPDPTPSPVTLEAKLALAAALRQHYQAHPAALELQAAAEIVPPTVANHQ